ncbi:MAG: HEAT repeat domain-containing protein [Anaerolineales bacterium]|nr:HEAT repeat domain-containing protein [Anaerolineales bacterium]
MKFFLLNRLTRLTLITFTITCLNYSCAAKNITPTPVMEEGVWPTPASTLQELITNISSEDIATRIVSIYALEKYGDEAISALPALISNLNANDLDLRAAAIYALGKLGPEAKVAVPDLIEALKNDNYIHNRSDAAIALGEIGDLSSIPALGACLFDNSDDRIERFDYKDPIYCAKSIAKITGEKFTDSDSTGYRLNENHIPLIVLDARKWWLETGQFQNWESIIN